MGQINMTKALPTTTTQTQSRVQDAPDSFFSIDFIRLSGVSFRPSITSLYRSVLAVHSTMTWQQQGWQGQRSEQRQL